MAERKARNVLGGSLEPCSFDPITGFYRDGCCATGPQDFGRHVICAEVTSAFLEFSQSRGNDLMTPRPEFGFPGLNPGDRWCLCADRWCEAMEHDVAPGVVLCAPLKAALDVINLQDLKHHALDLS